MILFIIRHGSITQFLLATVDSVVGNSLNTHIIQTIIMIQSVNPLKCQIIKFKKIDQYLTKFLAWFLLTFLDY